MDKLERLKRIAELCEREFVRCRNVHAGTLIQTDIDAAEVHWHQAEIDVLDFEASWAYRLGLRK